MARCKRCGAVFDYEKKEGVCPNCCFYNRPSGSPQYDEEWLRSYNVEDNTYQLPKISWQDEEEQKGGFFTKKKRARKGEKPKVSTAKDCKTEGSHVHRRASVEKHNGLDDEDRHIIKFIVFLFILIGGLTYVGMYALNHSIEVEQFFREKFDQIDEDKKNKEEADRDFYVRTASADQLSQGIAIGDLTFSSDGKGALVLPVEGQLPELPAGEKCIAIHIKDNSGSLASNPIWWSRPYVYDGKYYRSMVADNVLDSKRLNESLQMTFMPQFLTGKDFDGMAVYFIDKDATSVTLCIPDQRIEGENIVKDGVVEIELPVLELSKTDDNN